MTAIPDFTEAELAVAHDRVAERYGKPVEIQLADAEIRPDPAVHRLVHVPAIFWAERTANFVVLKLAEDQFRPQFFYRGHEQFGTGYEVFQDIGACVTTVLQVQADHERDRAGDSET
jgi:hypothetical protein